MKIDERKLRQLFQEQQQQTEWYLGTLKEDFDEKLQTVLEQTKVIPEIQRTLNATFDEVGKLRVDMESVKDVIKDHSQRLQEIESRF